MQFFRFRKIGVFASSGTLAVLLAIFLPTVPVHAATIRAQPVTTQRLSNPATFSIARDGRIFYGEKGTGRIRVINRKTGVISPFFTFPTLYSSRESGLLGIALHPRYPSVPYVYAYGTQIQGGNVWIRLLRITDRNGTGSSPVTLLTANTGDGIYPQHKGGRLLFGPDGMLYVFVGYSRQPANSQNRGVVFGKILRMTPSGQIPPGNPFPRSLIWSYGHRASFGMTFDPWSRRLWLTEGGPQCNDELNLVVKGGNFGWGPKATCKTPPAPPRNTNQDGPSPILPKILWPATYTNTGAVFCARCGLGPQNEGRLFVGSWGPGEIVSMALSRTRDRVISRSVVYRDASGLVLSMERGPDSALYFSNKTGIYKLVLG
jgi:glucose/arabinose dehydrogenase